MTYSISRNGTEFDGNFDDINSAIAEGISRWNMFYVGTNQPPRSPEDLWSADDWIEHVSCQDDYSGEHADDWFCTSEDILAELEAKVRKAMAAWLDKYDLRPKFYNVVDEQLYRVVDGAAVPVN